MDKVKEAIKTEFEVALPNGEAVTVAYGLNEAGKPDFVGKALEVGEGSASAVRVIGCGNDVGFDRSVIVARAADAARSCAGQLVALEDGQMPAWSKKMRLVVVVSLEEE